MKLCIDPWGHKTEEHYFTICNYNVFYSFINASLLLIFANLFILLSRKKTIIPGLLKAKPSSTKKPLNPVLDSTLILHPR